MPQTIKTVAQKMLLKKDMRAIFIDAPEGALADMGLPQLEVAKRLVGEFDHIHLFVTTQRGLAESFPKLKAHLKPSGKLWVSWPKNGQLNTDLSLPKVIAIGYGFGLVESTALSVNAIWSALKFTRPKAGKVYNNSYGKLVTG